MTAPIAVAIDVPDLHDAERLAALVRPHVAVVKVGLELFCAYGPAAADLAGDRALFLDLKLHDIPNTVAGAARAAARLDPAFLTVHASGGHDMVAAAAEAAPDVRIAGVTVLTSLTTADLAEPLEDAVRRLAVLAVKAGARALVCSPWEVAMVRAEVGPDVTLITPGVRPAGADVGDQARVATPRQAMADGADLVVVGRPITAAPDPAAAAAEIAASLS